MDPLALYILLVAAALIVCSAAALLARPDTRSCPSCEDEIAVNARSCRACGYAL
jgi:Uncharacterised protein family UPF0547